MQLIRNKRPKGVKAIDTVVGDIDVTVWYEYDAGVEGSRENGLPMEPDYEATIELWAVWVKDVNIISVFQELQLIELEEQILEQLATMDDFSYD